MNPEDYKVTQSDFKLENFDTRILSDEKDNEIYENDYDDRLAYLSELHEKLNAEEKEGILVVLQALDAAGKDEIIKYLFSSLLPQGLKVTSVSKPSETEKSLDYLRRIQSGLPKRGEIAILNRSYYENIISPQIHDSLEESKLPEHIKNGPVVEQRYKHIRHFEEYLEENGFKVIKLFFHMSKDVQRERFLNRLENAQQNHEFSFSDIKDRENWDDYQVVFERMIQETATDNAPWYILPADNPWLSRYIVIEALIDMLEDIDPDYPTFTEDDKNKVNELIEKLENNQI